MKTKAIIKQLRRVARKCDSEWGAFYLEAADRLETTQAALEAALRLLNAVRNEDNAKASRLPMKVYGSEIPHHTVYEANNGED